MRSKSPRSYVWRMQEASRRNKKGRVMRGMLMEIRKELVERGIEEKRGE